MHTKVTHTRYIGNLLSMVYAMTKKCPKTSHVGSNSRLHHHVHGKEGIQTVVQVQDDSVEKEIRTKATNDLRIEYSFGLQRLNSIAEENGLLSDDYRTF